jgi:hypothetical protein
MTDRHAALARLVIPVGALCVCAATDPNATSGWIFCPFRLLTGLPCPLCGMTRGLASLVRGRWNDAIAFHLFSPLVLAGIGVWILIDIGHSLRLWNARRIGLWSLLPAPWLAFLGVCTVYGALRWWGIIKAPLT